VEKANPVSSGSNIRKGKKTSSGRRESGTKDSTPWTVSKLRVIRTREISTGLEYKLMSKLGGEEKDPGRKKKKNSVRRAQKGKTESGRRRPILQ